MKKIILTLILVTTYTLSHCQGEITGAFGVPFGSSKAQVEMIMSYKGYKMDAKQGTSATFENIAFGAFKNCAAVFKFTGNKLFQITIFLPDVMDSKLIEQYDHVVEELSNKYGKPESFKNFKSPYKDGDGYETTAIKTGKATFISFWSGGQGSISAEIVTDSYVKVIYQDSVLIKEAINEQKTKNSNDY